MGNFNVRSQWTPVTWGTRISSVTHPDDTRPERNKDTFLRLEKSLAGKYRVLKKLGEGGFGTVYLVEIVAGMVGEKLALKLLSERRSQDIKFQK